LLEYARPARKPPSRPINVTEVIIERVDQERPRFEQVGGRLEIRSKINGYSLIDRHDISRCVINLLENARRYGAREHQPPDVDILIQTRADRLLIDVRDRGPGISPKDIARVMRPFSRGEAARTDGSGAGLGLSIVERLLSRAGGSLRLLPREGGGLTARMDLPRSKRRRNNRS